MVLWCGSGTRFAVGLSLALFLGACASGETVTVPKKQSQNETPEILDPTSIPKYVTPLVIPPAMPQAANGGPGCGHSKDCYAIAAREIEQQVLPPGLPKTTVWAYGSVDDPSTFNYPAYTINARVGRRVQVKWLNQLVDGSGAYLPHLLPVDQTLHWANPAGPPDASSSDPTPYTGPVPIVTHLHGSHVEPVSDGFPEAWYLPAANNIPAGYVKQGTHYGTVAPVGPGAALFEYRNDQRPTTLWYHDHTLGITRLNVYAGLAGFYLLRGLVDALLPLPKPAPQLGDPAGKRYYEIPIAIQDRTFKPDGSLFYPASRAFFDGFTGPFRPESDVPPIWNPEFFGNTMVVNGRTWPYHDVEPRRYRLRLLNGSNSRFLILKLSKPVSVKQIGNEGGFLPQPITVTEILLAPAERADVVVDFSSLAPGDKVQLLNLGPDEPFGGLPVDIPADPATTGQVMEFRVIPRTGLDNTLVPPWLPSALPLGKADKRRWLTLNEQVSTLADIPVAALLGTVKDGPITWDGLDQSGQPVGKLLEGERITENPKLGATEIWGLVNLTVDAHPIHLHLVMFEVVDRTPINADAFAAAQSAWLASGKQGPKPSPLSFVTGPAIPPEPWERGTKDTVIALPGQITRIKARFDIAGLYVWHCHILEHEDNEMMRPYYVGKPEKCEAAKKCEKEDEGDDKDDDKDESEEGGKVW